MIQPQSMQESKLIKMQKMTLMIKMMNKAVKSKKKLSIELYQDLWLK